MMVVKCVCVRVGTLGIVKNHEVIIVVKIVRSCNSGEVMNVVNC